MGLGLRCRVSILHSGFTGSTISGSPIKAVVFQTNMTALLGGGGGALFNPGYF